MKYSVAITENAQLIAANHLIRRDGQEDVLFGLYAPSSGFDRHSFLVGEILLPTEGDRAVHGNVEFTAQYVERALIEASKRGLGVVLAHSHPAPGWQGMSYDDIEAERTLASRVQGATGLPLLGTTIGTDEVWSARIWEKTSPGRYDRRWCESVRVVGKKLTVSFDDQQLPISPARDVLRRTISAWGEAKQATIARLHFGVVGCGSVGMIVAEGLAKIGVPRISLFDYDRIELHNLDRLLFGTQDDVALRRFKVDVLADGLRIAATADHPDIRPFKLGVTEPEGFSRALDCDVLISCVDKPWARSALNLIACSHLIPVVDGGIYIRAKASGGIRHADWRAHTVVPGQACLECLGQFDPGLVQAERDGLLDDPRYIEGLPEDHILKRRENVFPFSLACASLQLSQMLALIVGPASTHPGAQTFRYVLSELESEHSDCRPTCIYRSNLAAGDLASFVATGVDLAAVAARGEYEGGPSQPTRRRWTWARIFDRFRK